VTPPSTRPWLLATGGLTAMASAIGIGRFIYTPILPGMSEALHLSKGETGLIASANFVGYLIGALAAAMPGGRGNPRLWLLVALGVSAITTAAMGWSERLWEFLAWRLIGGIASAYVLVFASALVLERLTAAGRGGLSSVHFAGVGTGIAASALLTWALTAAGLDWRAMWLGGGALSLAGLGAVAALVPGAEAGQEAGTAAAASGSAEGRMGLLTLAYGLFGFGYIITITFIVAIVRGSPDASPYEPVFWLVLGVSAIPSVGLWVLASRWLGIMRAYACASILEAAGVFASVAWPDTRGLLVACTLLGGTFMGLTALGLIAARTFAASNPRRALALLTAAFAAGQIVGPVIAGYGFDLTGSFFLPSQLAVAALLVGALLALAIGRRTPERRVSAS
jgi:predicted MFS family arabinose efflux permease